MTMRRRCRVYDAECINPAHCDKADAFAGAGEACKAGDPECVPELSHERTSRSIGPHGESHGPVTVRHATATGYADQILAERRAWRGER
jgi:hypothetical protein